MRSLNLPLLLALLTSAPSAFAQGDPPPPDPAPPAPEPPPPAPADPPPPPAPAPPPPQGEAPPVVQMDDTAGQAQPAPEPAPPPGPAPSPPAAAPDTGTRAGPPPTGSDEWRFEFHGYLRAPMRIGVGKRDFTTGAQSETTFHAPIVPDDQYLSWQHTVHNQKDWAELFFSYGNSLVRGTVGLQAFNFTDAAWADADTQFGISQGYVTITPDLPYENLRIWAKVGNAWGKYGTAGRYDAGEYDTFLFGRTHAMGETARLEVDVGDVTVGVEEGFGAKRPDPSTFNRAKFTLLAHAHADFTYQKDYTLGLHYLTSWAQEEDREGTLATTGANLPDGSLDVYGADLRLDMNMFGYLYLGYSHIGADDALTVAPAIEVLHSFGGGQFTLGVTENYLDSPGCGGAGREPCSGGNGAVDSLLAQYEFSFANLFQNLEEPGTRFWGEGRDFRIKLYGMYNKITSNDPEMDGVNRLKYGTDLAFSALSWFGVGARYDRVQPHSDIPEQSFAILSPRLFFRTQWVTREEITLQYSRYMYNQRVCEGYIPPSNPPDPNFPGVTPADADYELGEEFCVQPPSAPVLPDGFGATSAGQDPNTRGAPNMRPDVNVIKLQATMWW